MERRQILKASGIVVTAGLTGLAGCSGDDDNAEPTDQSPGSGSNGNSTVEMVTSNGEYYFDPIGMFVEVDETVTFENVEGGHSTISYKDGVGQATTTRIPDGAQSWESSILTESGATYEHTFETAGTYDYYCVPHRSTGMEASFTVTE
jgi:plastocyanin